MTVSSGTDCVFADGVRILGCFPVKWDGQSPRFLPERLQELRTLGLLRNYHAIMRTTRGGHPHGDDLTACTPWMGTSSARRPRPARGRISSPSNGPLRDGPQHPL